MVDRKGKGKDMRVGAADAGVPDEQLDLAVTQVLDLLPDQDPGYVRYLLSHSDYPYRGDAERLIGALLEGTAPSQADVDAALAREGEIEGGAGGAAGAVQRADEFAFTRERRNVWDDEVMDLSRVKIGKKRYVVVLTPDVRGYATAIDVGFVCFRVPVFMLVLV